jgi:AcrR family transcriptional regulator
MANQKSEKSGGRSGRKASERSAKAASAGATSRAQAASAGAFDQRDQVIDAALALAAEKGWAAIGFRDIASASGVSLADLRRLYASKSAILADFVARIDAAVLARLEQDNGTDDGDAEASMQPRDRLFDVIMTRLELLAPYRQALRSILREGAALADGLPRVLEAQLASQRWMLAAAGIDARGIEGCLRSGGLGMVYARVLRVWLAEDDPALPRTMAELDKLLNRGEKTLRRLEGPVAFLSDGLKLVRTFGREARSLCQTYRRGRRERRSANNEAAA